MKLSPRKQLLKESESILKGIRKSVNESAVISHTDIQKIHDWMLMVIPLVIEESDRELFADTISNILEWADINEIPSHADRKNTFLDIIHAYEVPMKIILQKYYEHIKEVKKAERDILSVREIMRKFGSELKNYRKEMK
jgi:hypothetical protein